MTRRALVALLFFTVLLFAWELLVRAEIWSPYLVPSPTQVARYLWAASTNENKDLPRAILVTAKRLGLGYVVGMAIGFPLGLLIGKFRWAADTLGVAALGLQTLPSVCWVPLSLLWFGQGEGAVLFVVIMGTVWSIALATDSGIRGVPPLYSRAAQTMGSRGLHTLAYVTLPAALPSILSGMKQGWAFAWRSLMAAEIFVTLESGFGLGMLLHYGRDLLAWDQVVGVMLVIVGLGLLVDRAIFLPAERWLRRRWGIEARG